MRRPGDGSRLAAAAALGVVLGVATAHAQFLQWWTLLPWGAAAVALGWWMRSGPAGLVGATYGFTLSFAFLVAGYTGTASLVSRTPAFALLAVFGALCGLGLALLAAALGRALKESASA